MVELLTQNNVKAVISPASMQDALNLKRIVFKEIAKGGLDLDSVLASVSSGKNLKSLDTKDLNLSSILSTIFNVMGSEDLDNALIKCLSKSTYNREKITIDTFEDEKAREDYYELLLKCAEINLSPFFKGLVSVWNQKTENLTLPQEDSQKSK